MKMALCVLAVGVVCILIGKYLEWREKKRRQEDAGNAEKAKEEKERLYREKDYGCT